jgi:hypothetical protein
VGKERQQTSQYRKGKTKVWQRWEKVSWTWKKREKKVSPLKASGGQEEGTGTWLRIK